MNSVRDGFFDGVKSFVGNHKAFCALTLGTAVVGYLLGNLDGRAVSWISSWGITKKINAIYCKIISLGKLNNSSQDSKHKLLAAYNTPTEGWVMVPPKEESLVDQLFVVGSGAIGFEGNGRWKVHVSINPTQMEQAIPIIIDVLHDRRAPRLGFKIQTRANLNSTHQIGKEIAIIFDQQEEEAALKNPSNTIQDCLSLLWNKLYSAGIRPESGHVLTTETITFIETAPQGCQLKEKENLEAGKFDRLIPCPRDCNFFYYRDENFIPVRDDSIGDLEGIHGVYTASDIVKLARTNLDLAHNPTRSPDPFIKLKIQEQSFSK